MGLDMYLERRTYVKQLAHQKPEEKYSVLVKKGGKAVPKNKIDPAKISYVIEEAAYWRKANAIHQWFVANVQDGEDDCKEYWVSIEQLRELLSVVDKVLDASELIKGKVHNGTRYTPEKGKEEIWEDGHIINDSTVAEELLPVQSGFFFGGTDYDEYYYQDLVDTKRMLEEALAAGDGGDFYYQSSW